MNSTLRNTLWLTGFVVVCVSCGTYNKLLKSGNSQAMYEAALEYYQEKKNEKAIALFDQVDYIYAGTARHDTIKFYSAVSYFRRGDYFSSTELLEDFRRRFGRSPFLEEAEYLIAMGYYLQSPEPELDQTPTKLAIGSFYEYLNRYPNSVKYDEVTDYIAELQQKLYIKSYLNAKLYYDTGWYKSAIHTFRVALSEYPETTFREDILYLLTKATYEYAENSMEHVQRGRYLDMIDAYYDLISEYPESRHLREVKPMYERVQSLIKDRYDEDVERELELQQLEQQLEENFTFE